MEHTKSRDGEFIGSGMRADFLKEKIGLAHCKGYAVLVKRVISADEPDDHAIYNLYQIDANKGLAAPDLYEACKAQHNAIDILFAMLIERDNKFFPSKSGLPWDAMVQGNQALAKVEK